MDVLRMLDTYCPDCDDLTAHTVPADDPASCFCGRCGAQQVLVVPLAAAAAAT